MSAEPVGADLDGGFVEQGHLVRFVGGQAEVVQAGPVRVRSMPLAVLVEGPL
ncbi:hypothetical protein [Streptomyces vastus]|uniref:hypothetical protein n=1 Tax=Streptomyces vastus TaxID=285451 RepID=UPI0031D129B6